MWFGDQGDEGHQEHEYEERDTHRYFQPSIGLGGFDRLKHSPRGGGGGDRLDMLGVAELIFESLDPAGGRGHGRGELRFASCFMMKVDSEVLGTERE